MIATEPGHFVAAKRHVRILLGAGTGAGVLGLLLAAGRVVTPSAALLLAAAGLLGGASVTLARRRLLEAREAASGASADSETMRPDLLQDLLRWAGRIATWPQTLIAASLSLLAAAELVLAPWTFAAWPVSGGGAPGTTAPLVLGAALIVAAFPVLVLERHLAGLAPAELPEAPALAHLLRVPLIALLGTGIAAILAAKGLRLPAALIALPIRLLCLGVALELAGRAGATLFLPAPPRERPRLLAHSTLAGLLRPRAAGLGALGATIEQQFGINLARSWALGFVRRALPVVALGVALLAWGLTGLTALRLDERAVYERFGAPVAVLGPGLHAHLPWPAGTIRRVELGVVHDIPIVFGAADEAAVATALPGAEDSPPVSADRLWDQAHPSEASYLIASAAHGRPGGRQSFQIVNIDLRLLYRIGLSDADAEASAYRVAEPERLLRAAAGRVLARYFAGRTLLGLLGEDRETLTAELRTRLAHELDASTSGGANSGIEVLAMVVEAIHPPPGAASAYHDVQAAGIRAETAIAHQRGGAALSASRAAQKATAARNTATGTAASLLAEAHAQERLFAADRASAAGARQAFLLERWLDRVQRGLAHRPVVLVDHRLERADAPMLDLRPFAPSAAAAPP